MRIYWPRVEEIRSIMNVDDDKDVLRHDKELHYTMLDGAIKGPRNPYILQMKKDPGINNYVQLKRLAKDRETGERN